MTDDRLTADDVAELRRAYEIVRDGRRYTLEHFGPATEHAYVGRHTARAYEDAIDLLVAALGDAFADPRTVPVTDGLDLAALRTWAERRDPEHPDWGTHNYDARCPWCRDTVHDTAIAVLDEIERLRAERAGMQRERQSHYVRVEDPPEGWVWLSNHYDEDAEVMHELWANHRELEGRELRFVATRLVWRERFVTEWVDEDRDA